jgi:hypothetical protein
MGHPKHKFETMMMTLSHGPKVDEPLPVFNLGKSITEIPAILKKIETHCFEFAHEFLKAKSGNFTRTELFFDADGLVAQYHCDRDGRTYTIKITASK